MLDQHRPPHGVAFERHSSWNNRRMLTLWAAPSKRGCIVTFRICYSLIKYNFLSQFLGTGQVKEEIARSVPYWTPFLWEGIHLFMRRMMLRRFPCRHKERSVVFWNRGLCAQLLDALLEGWEEMTGCGYSRGQNSRSVTYQPSQRLTHIKPWARGCWITRVEFTIKLSE